MIFYRDIYVTLSQPIVLSIQTLSIQKNELAEILLEAAFATVFPDENPGWPMAGVGNRYIGRGRDEDCSSPPAQIPACAANAPGSSLGFWRRSGDMAKGVAF